MRYRDQRRSESAPARQNFTPRKSMGQNFLQDEEISRWIGDQVQPDGADLVVEIGPGMGALTKHLVGRPKKLILIEKDAQLGPELQGQFEGRGDVEVIHNDATRIDLRPWFRHGPLKLVGNLPYSVGGEILKHWLTPPTPVSCAVFMLQKEVCDRLAATCEDDSYGALSLLVQKDWNVEMLRVVPPEVFNPKPKVDSAIIRLTPRDPATLPVFDHVLFDRLVRMGFSQRRKQLKNLLPDAPGGWDSLIQALGVSPTVRAEALSLAQWIQIARHYEQRHEADAGQKASEMFDVVNESNEVIGQLTRGEVHKRKLLHRAVHIFVINKRGQIYLQQRSHLKDVSPLKWDSSAAGHLDAGEDYATAAVRELGEEIGIHVPSTELAAQIPAGDNTDHEFVELRLAHHDGPVRCLPEEIATGEWFKPKDIDAWVDARPQDFAKGFVTCWKAWRK
ncbi:16S rRNA (adenine(1518)-N(6)/adenine(1519)-N(6))-dimethyltransferase RsmA [Prosthecobacter vanneervenii]|uniref:Ribosomal RNA small subunit methyltransferase A n=1 Tax=Prosthecobacter vanneervenii TaxID=48466 RepID=A0A7W7Y6V1_9BACT|nr:16S rRNA (adenine(1518)-N(6)/adenine(1519)-N(6))-dimethyltransferase RsmA [Prosthecobacter vanneervenii]MBB5030682.1 16S rRNA (adenine1518-N6/adenine1519-N6)-dimethyltransferase [Prosthecobacter vanneervenii]